ncbi:MAG: hypothetical protein OQK99_04435 [Gammaproteobacteria bacterium]|nr:hypothetical protein [Gammaproteobacteria bacterium]
MRRILILLLGTFLLVSGCSDGKNAASDEAANQDPADITIESIENASGEVTLLLTHDHVAMQLSEETLQEIREEFDDAREEESDSKIVNQIKNTVLDRVENLLSRQVKYPVDSIDRITWDDGEMVFTLKSGDEAWDTIWIGSESVLETFAEDDALVFIEAFERLKRARQ